MEWDKEAAADFIELPLAKSLKESVKVHAEKLARKNRRRQVTLNELNAAKKVVYGSVSEESRQREIDKRITAGETDLRKRLEAEGREVLAREIDLFKVDICPGEVTKCVNLLVPLTGLKKEIEQTLRELKISEIIADLHRDDERIMAHHRLNISISGCPVGCTAPEARAFGVHGVAKPRVVPEATCTECYACVDACLRGAVTIKNGVPYINTGRCDMCGFCQRACPTGKLVPEKRGYRIMVGGRFGRFHQVGAQLFRIADRETLLAAVEAAVKTIREEAEGYEDLYSIVNRLGISPIFERVYREKAE